MRLLAITANELRRMSRQRSNLFFVFVFPMILILLIGAAFGGADTPRLAVTGSGGPLGEALTDSLSGTEDLDVRWYEDPDALLTAVERGDVDGGLVIPAGYDRTLRAGREARLLYYARPDQEQLRLTVQAAVAGQATLVRAARFAESETDASFDRGLAVAAVAADRVPGVEVRTTTAGEALFPATLGRFDLGASSELILFVFLTAMTGSVALIESRRLGVSRRMLATPTSAREVIGGEAAGRVAIALIQGLFIIVGSALLFGVDWGDPVGAAALLLAFGLVGAGAGMLMGSLFRTEQQAGAVGLLVALGMAALGGAMFPIELFSPTMQTVAHITPHAWAIDGFAELVRRGGTIVDILPQLGILAIYAAALLALASWRLRTVLTR